METDILIIDPTMDFSKKEFIEAQKVYNFKNRDEYRDFRLNLIFFWEKAFSKTKGKKINSIKVRFFGEGLTEAYVFRCEVGIENNLLPYTRVIKYDCEKNIKIEKENYLETGDRNAESVFPRFEEVVEVPNHKAFLSMSSIVDSETAIEAYSLIDYLWKNYYYNQNELLYFSKKISDSLEDVCERLFYVFYRTEKEFSFNDKSKLHQYFSKKINLDLLNKNNIHKERFLESCKISGEDSSAYSYFLNLNLNFRPVISNHAIHGDLNPNNILLALNKRGEIKPMVIDFFEVKLKERNEWVPLLYDIARLESQILFYFFYNIYSEELMKNADLLPQLIEKFSKIIQSLNEGKYNLLHINNIFIENQKFNFEYIYKIIFNLRKSIIDYYRERNETGLDEFYGNYIYSAMSFAFFFIKFDKENGVKIKRHFAVKAAFEHRRTLLDFHQIELQSLFQKNKIEKMDVDIILKEYLKDEIKEYLVPKNAIQAVNKFLNDNEKQILIIDGFPGVGKTSFSKYMTLFLNDEIPENQNFRNAKKINSLN